MSHDIRFCTAPDGVRLAYATHGQGPPLVRTATWLTHLEHDWESPVWKHWLRALGERVRRHAPARKVGWWRRWHPRRRDLASRP